MPAKYMRKRKPKALRKVMRKTGARQQAKQIATLSRQLTAMNREQTEMIRTSWQRNNLPIGNTGPIFSPYVCPLPYALCDPLGTSPVVAAQRFADNRQNASQQFFTKRLVFGYSEAAANAGKIYHTGGRLRYQITTTEPSYTKITLALVKPKKHQADQLVVDRGLKGIAAATAPGSASQLYDDIDFTTHSGAGGSNSTWFGAEVNRKYWSVLYRREVALTHPGANNTTPNQATPANTAPKNNALVATGSIKLPASGIIKAVGSETQTIPAAQTPAMEQQYVDQRNEDSVYLVAILNDTTLDTEAVSMGFVVTDYYKAVV